MILGLYTLIVGVVPAVLLLVRWPEDMGLSPDQAPSQESTPHAATASQGSACPRARGSSHHPELHFTLQQALRPRASWRLAVFSATGFMAQAGVSLHQVSHLHLVGQALGPVTAGFVFDVTGAYHQACLGFAGVVLLGSACVLAATPPRSSEAL